MSKKESIVKTTTEEQVEIETPTKETKTTAPQVGEPVLIKDTTIVADRSTTWYRLAIEYNTTVEELKAKNNNESLYAGKIVRI